MKKRIATEMTAIINTISITVVIVIFAPKLPQLSHWSIARPTGLVRELTPKLGAVVGSHTMRLPL